MCSLRAEEISETAFCQDKVENSKLVCELIHSCVVFVIVVVLLLLLF